MCGGKPASVSPTNPAGSYWVACALQATFRSLFIEKLPALQLSSNDSAASMLDCVISSSGKIDRQVHAGEAIGHLGQARRTDDLGLLFCQIDQQQDCGSGIDLCAAGDRNQ